MKIRDENRTERCACEDGSCEYCIKYYSDTHIERISCRLGKDDWQHEEWTNGKRTVKTMIPPKLGGDSESPSKMWDGWASYRMARRMLSKPAATT